MEKEENSNSKNWSIQDYLSLGYLYLLILGIFKDTIFYSQLGVNIISYSNVQDILLSPIIHMTSDLKSFLIFFVGMPLFSIGIGYLSKKYHNKNRDKEWYRTKKGFENWDKAYGEEGAYGFLFPFILICLFGGFIGSGLGGGQKIANKLANGELENNQQIIFDNNDTINVHEIGHNSEYLFYATENDTIITIVPIQDNIKKIRNLD